MINQKENIQLLSNAISYLSDAGQTIHFIFTNEDKWRSHKLDEAKNDIYVAIQTCNTLLKSFADDIEEIKDNLPFEPDKKETDEINCRTHID